MVSEYLVHGWMDLKKKPHGGKAWQSQDVYFMELESSAGDQFQKERASYQI